MNKKRSPYLVLGLLLLALVGVKYFSADEAGKKTTTTTKQTSKAKAEEVNRNRGFDRRTEFLEYSKHASCRMDCRKISKKEVKEIMENGTINYKKSDLQNKRCPRYAVEGETSDGQKVRIVFAQCDYKTTVVTVIDLKTDWQCACPGDDK